MDTLYGGVVDDNLTGATLGERHKSLNTLLKLKLESRDDAEDILSPENLASWQNKTQADRIFIAKLAARRNDIRVINQILETDNKIDLATALHSTRMFECKTDSGLDADYFMKEIFPRASYHTICRVVSALSAQLKNQTLAQDLYNQVLSTYGQQLAVKLLPKCSVDFIRSQIMSDMYEVPTLQLKYIYKKDPSLAVEYLESVLQNVGADKAPINYVNNINYKPIWVEIAQDRPGTFLNNYKNHSNAFEDFRLGRRNTLGVIRAGLKIILDNPKQYTSVLHLPTLLQELKGENFDRFIMAFMADEEKNFQYHSIEGYLKHLKMPNRIEFLMKIYASKYNGASLLSSNHLHSWNLAKFLPKEERNAWGLRMRDSTIDHGVKEELCLVYVDPEVAIPRYKVLLRSASEVQDRLNILFHMIDCCGVNENRAALLGVLRFVASRFRNDQIWLRTRFLQNLNSIKLYELSTKHWEPIMEMIDFMHLMKEIDNNYYQAIVHDIYVQHLRYCLDNNLDMNSTLVKVADYNPRCVKTFVGTVHEFVVLDAINARLKEIVAGNPDHVKTIPIIESVLESYNTRSDRKNHCFTECDWLMEAIGKVIDTAPPRSLGAIVKVLIGNIKTRMMFADSILKVTSNIKLYNNYLKHDAGVIVRNLNGFVENLPDRYDIEFNTLFYKLKTFMSEPFAEPLTREMNDQFTNRQYRGHLLKWILVFKQDEDAFKKYFPRAAKVDLKTDADLYKYSETVIKSIKYIIPPVSFETLSHFVQGDYLKYTLASVTSLSYYKPLPDSIAFITRLINTPQVSVKKHGLRLACFLYPKDKLVPLYASIWEKDSHTTTREVVFKRTFKLFLAEREVGRRGEIWEVLKRYMQSFTESDKNLFGYLVKVQSISPELITDYCTTCWRTLDALIAQKAGVNNLKDKLFSTFIECMEYLSEEFRDYVINEYGKSFGSGEPDSNLLQFTVSYLLKAKPSEVQKQNLDKVCLLFEKFIEEKWDLEVDGSFKYREVVRTFVKSCVRGTYNLTLPTDPVDLLRRLSAMLRRLPFCAAFHTNIIVSIAIVYREYVSSINGSSDVFSRLDDGSNAFVRGLGERISIYLDQISSEYGNEIIKPFLEAFAIFDTDFWSMTWKSYFDLHFISGLLSGKSVLCSLVAIHMLPVVDKKHTYRSVYDSIVRKIIAEGNATVKMHLVSKIPLKSQDF